MTQFTATEAAAITGLGIKEVNNAIDKESFLGASGKQTKSRYLDVRHLLYLQARWELKETELAMPLKRRIFEEINSHPRSRFIYPVAVMAIDMGKVRRKLERSLTEFAKARRMVKSDPGILGGEPVIKGTRVPVYLIGRMLGEGASVGDIQKSYPSLTEEQIRYAALYSEAHPRKGRTPKSFRHAQNPVSTARIALE